MRLDLVLNFGEALTTEAPFEGLLKTLRNRAPTWTKRMFIRRPLQSDAAINAAQPHEFARAIWGRAYERGAAFHTISKAYHKPRSDRRFGSAEIRGADPSLILVVSVDDDVLPRVGDKHIWGNVITLQLCRARLENLPASKWAKTVFAELCDSLSPWYGRACLVEEFERKNIDTRDGGRRVVGADVSLALPGIYWVNFFGRPYVDLIGRERLQSAPGCVAEFLDDGVLVQLDDEAKSWRTEAYQAKEEEINVHLGSEFFFFRDCAARETRAPVFNEYLRT